MSTKGILAETLIPYKLAYKMRTNRLSPGRITWELTQQYKNSETVLGKNHKMKTFAKIIVIVAFCISSIAPFQNQFMDEIDKDFLAKGH